MEDQPAFRPVDLIADAVRHVSQTRRIDALGVEGAWRHVVVVARHHRIDVTRCRELFRRMHASRYDGIWIYLAQ
jgi:hypothetical protein